MRLAKYSKSPGDTERYTIDYTDWLDTGELLSTKTFAVTTVTGTSPPTLTVQSSAFDPTNKIVSFFVAGGDPGATYKVVLTITTSGGQTKDDHVLFAVTAE